MYCGSVFTVRVIHPAAGLDQFQIKGSDLEGVNLFSCCVGNGKGKFFHIGFAEGFPSGEGFEDIINGFFGKADGHHPAVEHVLTEDPGKVFRNDQIDFMTLQYPGGMFPGGTAAEVGSCYDDAFSGDIPFGIESGQGKIFQTLGFKGGLGGFRQIFCRNDLIGIDIGTVQKEDFTAEIFHGTKLLEFVLFSL